MKKMHFFYRWSFYCGMAVSLQAQAPIPNSGGGAPSQSNVAVSPGTNFFESDTVQGFSKDVFNVNSDSVNLEDGTFNWKGRTFNLGDSRIARARFERYLATPDLSSDEEIYLGVLERVTDNLSLVNDAALKSNDEMKAEIFKAWQLLFVASKYEMDGGVSSIIANQVYNIWRVRNENYDLVRARGLLEEDRSRYEDWLDNDTKVKGWKFEDVQGKKAEGKHTGKIYDGVTDATFRAERLTEIQARIAAMDTASIANGLQAKLQFQSQTLNMLLQRRFDHTVISSTFYRYSFKGGHMGMQVGLEQLKEFMPISDFSPTIETLELLAKEAQNDVRTGMRTVESLYEGNELYSALERLQETFFLGEHMPDVLKFPTDKKRELLTLYRKVREVKNLADLKDFETLENTVGEIQELAYDFPTAKILSAVRSAQRMSNLALMASQQAMAVGDTAKAEGALEKATTLWPLNPAIKSFTMDMASRVNVATQASLMFDQVYERGDLRQIYERRTEFGAALLQDAERSQLLKEAIEKMGKVDILIAQSEELVNQENAYAAWEILLSAHEIEPTDPTLARAQASLAPRVANFVSALDKAKRAEAKEEYAISVMQYLEAQDIYPASKSSRLGLERTSQALMQQISQGQQAPVAAKSL